MNFGDYGKQITSVGPWGGQGGSHWHDGVYSTIRQLEIAHGAGIDSITIEYDKNGSSVWSNKHGGNRGAQIDQVRLDYPDEFLISLHGYYGSLQEWGPSIVRSLTFESNKRVYGPFGVREGTYFSVPTSGGKIVGFHGKCGWFLDSIGAFVEPVQKPLSAKATVHSQQSVVQRSEKHEFSMIQGNLGNKHEFILAVRQKEDYSSNESYSLSRQSSKSSNSSYAEPENKVPLALLGPIERVPSKTFKGVVTYGPWGGNNGSVFDDGIYDGVRQIHVSRNVGIVSIRVCYEQNGLSIWGSKNGGTGSFKTDKIVFDYPSEILTHITGNYGPLMYMGPNVIRSLVFHTTKGVYGPYGEQVGEKFTTRLKDGTIVGFHGRKGLFLDAVGVHVMEGKVVTPPPASGKVATPPPTSGKVVTPPPTSGKVVTLPPASRKVVTPPPTSGKVITTPPASPASNAIINPNEVSTPEAETPKWSFKLGNRGFTQEVAQRIVKDPAPYGPGPFGGDSGKPWDDGVFTGIKQVILTRSEEAIYCIEIEYDRYGQSVWSVKHGGSNGGEIINAVKLEYPNEVLTCISGYYAPISHGMSVIKSLTFYTTRKKIGPFGKEMGTYFTSNMTEGKVVGFHGRSGMYLDAIGVHMQHWLGNHKPSKGYSSSLKKLFH